jgi:hypothetical protein
LAWSNDRSGWGKAVLDRCVPVLLLAVLLLSTACGGAPVVPVALPADRLSGLALTDPDGRVTPLAGLLGRTRATVLVFWAAGCPCVRRYQARTDDLWRRYGPRGVQVVGVAANADEGVADITSARSQRGFALPVWRDPRGEVAQALGARTTPTAVLLLPDGRVAYFGWIDNERLPGDPAREAWLETAIERVLAADPHAERRPTYGCRITAGWTASAPEPATSPALATAAPCGCHKSAPTAPDASVPPGATP